MIFIFLTIFILLNIHNGSIFIQKLKDAVIEQGSIASIDKTSVSGSGSIIEITEISALEEKRSVQNTVCLGSQVVVGLFFSPHFSVIFNVILLSV